MIIRLKDCARVYIINVVSRGEEKRKEKAMIYDLQKASMWKRISAFMFDFILFLTVFVGIALLLSAVTDYDGNIASLEAVYDKYEKEYDIVLGGEPDGYDTMTDEEKKAYDERYAQAENAFQQDAEGIRLSSKLMSATLLILAIGLFISYLISDFIVPLILGNGQTLGKKIFGICLMRDDGVKISPVMLFVRAILGKFTVETMVPVFLVILVLVGGAGIIGLLSIVAIFVFDVVLIVKTKTNSTIHDMLSYTVVVDKESQLIFETKEAMIEYKNKIHAEESEKKLY